MVLVKDFLIQVEAIAAEEPSYRTGGMGQDGTCDCIGLIVGAIRRAGGKWTGLKGTNYAARNEVTSLEPIRSVRELEIGEAVFKARSPGDAGYDGETMTGRYAASPDRRDYYHIGVVESVNPLRIRHMTSPRVMMDTTLGKWAWHGKLKLVCYGEESRAGETAAGETGKEAGEMGETGRFLIYGGNRTVPVNLRASGSRLSPIIGRIPQHTAVELEEYGEAWCRVKYGGRPGYVQSVFVHAEGEEEPGETLSVPRKKLEEIHELIRGWLSSME